MGSPTLSLLLVGTLALTETWAGSHSLRYFHTAVIRPERGDSWFTSMGYVDDQPVQGFDSDSASQKEEPRVTWIQKVKEVEPRYWELNTQTSRGNAQISRVILETLRGYYNQSRDGVHTFQRLVGCEVSPDGRFSDGFVQYAYDGSDYLALDRETLTWMAAQPQAENTKRKLEADRSYAERMKVYVEEECVQWVHKYLEMGKEALLRTDPPSGRVTRHTGPHGEVTLRCWAQGFYPKEISMTWLRDEQEQLQDTEFIETRPGGDGTFQKWAAVGMTSGIEGEYTCRVQHEGLREPLTLRWEPESSSIGIIVAVIALVLIAVIVGLGIWIWKKKNSGGKRNHYVPAAGNDTAQGSAKA